LADWHGTDSFTGRDRENAVSLKAGHYYFRCLPFHLACWVPF
jgi:hypothetical protein